MTGRGPVSIEPMRRRHLRRVLQIDSQIGAEGRWSAGLFLAELNRANRDRCYVVARSPRVVGFAGLLMTGPEAHVTTVAVDWAHRRQGIGRALMLHLSDAATDAGCEAMTLEVRSDNEEAIALYRSFGFAPAGVRRDYYGKGTDALIMWASEIDGADHRARLGRLRSETSVQPQRERP